MRRMISFQGGMASGKTTLLKRLEAKIKDAYISYENCTPIVNQRKSKSLDIYTREGFVYNQQLFIEAEIKRFKDLPNQNIIFDRGPEDTEFYTLHFPKANDFDWDIEVLLKEELAELRKCRSDLIIYLDATEDTLKRRKLGDSSRKRNSFTKNMKLYQYEKDWYMKRGTVVVDVNNKTPEEVEHRVLNILKDVDFI